jgi:transposase-like protein
MSTQIRVDMYQNDHLLRRFSESFKLKILAELSTGKYSKRELSRLYGVASSTINDWVRQNGLNEHPGNRGNKRRNQQTA